MRYHSVDNIPYLSGRAMKLLSRSNQRTVAKKRVKGVKRRPLEKKWEEAGQLFNMMEVPDRPFVSVDLLH